MFEERTFRNYDEAKNFVIDALKARDYTSIEINKKRNSPLWVVKMKLPSVDFCKNYILVERG